MTADSSRVCSAWTGSELPAGQVFTYSPPGPKTHNASMPHTSLLPRQPLADRSAGISAWFNSAKGLPPVSLRGHWRLSLTRSGDRHACPRRDTRASPNKSNHAGISTATVSEAVASHCFHAGRPGVRSAGNGEGHYLRSRQDRPFASKGFDVRTRKPKSRQAVLPLLLIYSLTSAERQPVIWFLLG